MSRVVTRRRLGATSLAALTAAQARAAELRELTFSYQRSSALIIVLMTDGELARTLADAGFRPTYAEFERILDTMTADAVTFHGDVADSVPIFAQAAGAPLAYYAMERGSPPAEALIVHADSPIHNVSDLRGRSVAVSKGSGAHYMLLELLRRAAIPSSAVSIAFFEASDGSAAFAARKVDAWATWDPFLAITEARMPVRTIADGTGVTAYNRFYMVDAAFAHAHPEVVGIVYAALEDASAWIHADGARAAALLSPYWGHAPDAVIARINARRGYRIQPVDKGSLVAQQRIADDFHRAGLIPDPIRVADTPVWRPSPAGSR